RFAGATPFWCLWFDEAGLHRTPGRGRDGERNLAQIVEPAGLITRLKARLKMDWLNMICRAGQPQCANSPVGANHFS
ncbi:MAG: hypothetical protein SGI90_17200, partial [Candidatus Eisenbacteria bacterium]|nr:hypothetical protein [Candidatus Eisenbacteria bacterium]